MISGTHLHAMAIHFPIALLCIGFLSAVISLFFRKDFFSQAAFYLLVLGALGSIAAYLSGNAAGEGIEEGALGKAVELHEQAATISLWLTILTAAFYLFLFIRKNTKTWAKFLGILLFAGTVVSIARTGYLGGQLVYKHGAGIELSVGNLSTPADDK